MDESKGSQLRKLASLKDISDLLHASDPNQQRVRLLGWSGKVSAGLKLPEDDEVEELRKTMDSLALQIQTKIEDGRNDEVKPE